MTSFLDQLAEELKSSSLTSATHGISITKEPSEALKEAPCNHSPDDPNSTYMTLTEASASIGKARETLQVAITEARLKAKRSIINGTSPLKTLKNTCTAEGAAAHGK